MFFTLEDYKKIYEWISRNSIKDTEFNEALTPLDETDTITLIQNGANVRISLKDLVDLLFLMGVSDFLNITDKYREKNITLDLAIELIPYTARKVGQVITFLDTNNKWKIYLFRGELTQWDLLNLWEDILDIEAHTINSILPDEEDLTKTLPDDKGNSYLSFKDRKYNPNDFSGLGRIILRKNIMEVEDPIYGKVKKNILYQDMFTQSNTIYEIRYDFTLNGNITIPANCILKFDGGSISGEHTLTGTNTGIQAGLVKIFDIDVTLAGSWNVAEAYPEWFGAVGDGITDDTNALQKNFDAFTNVKLQNTYYISNCTIFKNNTFVYGKGTIKSYFTSTDSSIPWPGIINITADNVTIDGITVIGEGSALTDNTKIESCINAYGEASDEKDSEGMYIVTKWVENLRVVNCNFSNANCAVRADFGKNISVSNCYIHNMAADGIMYLSVLDGNITDNRLINFNLEHVYGNSYPIAMSKHYGHPNCQRIVVKGNIIENNPYWEGIDTHDGIDIVISENILRNVYTGIACVSTGNIGSVQHCVITGNRIYGNGNFGNGGIVVTGYTGTYLTTNDNVVANNSIENCHYGVNSYLVVDSIFDSNTIKNCVEGFCLASTVRCTLNNNNIYIDDAFSSGTKCGISISIISGDASINRSLLIQNNNIKVTGANYGIFAYKDLLAVNYKCLCKNNSIVTERTAEEIAADTADGITRDYRLYGLDSSITKTIGNIFTSDLFNTITGSVSTMTIPSGSEVAYLEVPSGFYNYVSNKINIEVSIERDLPNIIVSKVTQSGNNRILLYNPTSSPFTLYGTSFTLRFSNIRFKE